MSGLRFTMTVDGEEQIDRSLSRFGAAFTDVTPWFKAMVNLLSSSVASNFSTQGGKTGGWAPLSQRYADWKFTQVGAKPILELTGSMKKSFRTRRMTGSVLEWGSNSRYAIFHQRGTVKMPQRKIVDLDENDRRTAMKELQKFIVRQGYPGATGT